MELRQTRSLPLHIGVFTNLTRDHLDAHGSAEHYLASKAQLFVHLPASGAAVLNGCDPASVLLAEVVPRGVRVLHYGAATRGQPVVDLDLSATSVQPAWSGTRIELAAGANFGPVPQTIQIRAVGDVVVIAGKGHETQQQVGDETRWFSDRQVVEQIVGTRSE